MPRRKPYRQTNEISQSYNDGLVKIYSVADTAKPGFQPKPKKTLKYTLRFARRALGINRVYLSRQDQTEIKHVLRVQKVNISAQDYAEICGDDHEYRITLIQQPLDVYPASLDISLSEIDQGVEATTQ